jgi:PEP-CTERM motif
MGVCPAQLSQTLSPMKPKNLIVLGLLAHSPAWAQTLVSDNFSSGNLSVSTPSGTSQWYFGGAAANAYVTNNSALMITGLTGNTSPQGAMAAFQLGGTELNLQVGQSLQLSFSYLYANNNSTDFGFGFGFYDSHGKQLTSNGTGFNNGIFNGWTAISAFGVFGPDPSGLGRFHVADRVTAANNLLTPFTAGVLGSTYQTDGFQTNHWYNAALTITYTSLSQMVETAQIGNEILTVTNAPVVTGFDTVGITEGGEQIGTLGLSNVTVVVIPATPAATPEPSTLGLAALGMGLAGWICWRRQHGTGRF